MATNIQIPADEAGHIASTLAGLHPDTPVSEAMRQLSGAPATLPVDTANLAMLKRLPSAAQLPNQANIIPVANGLHTIPRIKPPALNGPQVFGPMPVDTTGAVGTPQAALGETEPLPSKPRSLFGKIAHGFETAGKDIAIGAGTMFAPGAMMMIPGTPEHDLLMQKVGRENLLAQGQASEFNAEAQRNQELAKQLATLTPAEKAEYFAKAGLENAQGNYIGGPQTQRTQAQTDLTNIQSGLANWKLNFLQNYAGANSIDPTVFDIPKLPDPSDPNYAQELTDGMNQLEHNIAILQRGAAGDPQAFAPALRSLQSAAYIFRSELTPSNPNKVSASPADQYGVIGPPPGPGASPAEQLNYINNLHRYWASKAAITQGAKTANETRTERVWNPATGSVELVNVPAGPGVAALPPGTFVMPTGQAASRLYQALGSQSLIAPLIQAVTNLPEDVLGPTGGSAQRLARWIGGGSPEARMFNAQIKSWAAMQPGLHGFRGLDAAKFFEKMLGPQLTRASMIAAIEGISAATFAMQAAAAGGELPPQVGAGRSITIQQIEAAAKSHNIPLNDAIKQAVEGGFLIAPAK